MKKKSNYSEEFKKDALQLLKSNGKSRSAIERDLGLSQNLLRQWQLRYTFGGQGHQVNYTTVTEAARLTASDCESSKPKSV